MSTDADNSLQDLTIGITAFNRPECLERLVQSIRERFPAVPILVADNGWEPADLEGWSGIELVEVERDCGLSACRNWIADQCTTDYLVLCEEDFVFDDRTDLAAALAVLEENPQLGMIGGSLEVGQQMQHYARRFQLETAPEGQVLRAVPAGGPMQQSGPARWRLCDMVFNWGILRTAAARECPWDEALKLGEHVDWFLRLQLETAWQVAHTPDLVARHERQEPGDYPSYRSRAAEFLELFRRKHDLCRFEHVGAAAEPLEASGSVVVMGIGHSGTSVVSRMLGALGFYAGPADEEFGEHPGIRELNETAWQTRELDLSAGWDHLEALARPWVIKDPRFIHTLDLWLPVLGIYKPTLLWVVRDGEDVAASYERRGENYRGGQTLEGLYEMARRQFDEWPWGKLRIEFEKIADAVSLFDLARAGVTRGQSPGPVPPQAEPRVVPPADYEGEPGGPCLCTDPGACRRHPAIQKIGRLFDICQGTVLTPEKCRAYRTAWDEQSATEQVIEPAAARPLHPDPASCRHRGEHLRTCSSGGG